LHDLALDLQVAEEAIVIDEQGIVRGLVLVLDGA
jgi:hypothetical protein